jgi:hypothetical protein
VNLTGDVPLVVRAGRGSIAPFAMAA